MYSVLQITDCHLVVEDALLIGVDTQASLEAVLIQATKQREPDAIIASGDLAHDPLPAVYDRFLETVRRYSKAPLVCLPGNHDVLSAMEKLPRAPLEIGGWGIVPLDSHEDEVAPAKIEQKDLAVVDDLFGKIAAEHVLVTTHHPFVEVNAPWLDRDRIQNPEDLVEWLSERSRSDSGQEDQVERLKGIVFGHAHQEINAECAGVPVYGTPSTCFQFKPHSQQFALDDQPPGYRWLELHDDGSIVTSVERVDSFKVEPVLEKRR